MDQRLSRGLRSAVQIIMRGLVRNYLWRKRVTPGWLSEQEAALALATRGTHSIVERPGARRLQLEMFCETATVAKRLKAAFGGAIDELPPDWHAQFLARSRMKPLRIGRRLVVVGDAASADGAATLVIPAGAAFGTGEHATTAMSLRMLERVSRAFPPGWRMLDAGTGSGILALAGSRFGAGKVLAIDNDAMALATARENARLNGVRNVHFIVGDVQKRIRGTFHVITANLYSELLIALLPAFRNALSPDGRLILSGVLRTQASELARALRTAGFRAAESRRRGKWIALVCSGGSVTARRRRLLEPL
jgi:ribosomal protein L11 methyltransferase